MEVNEALDLRNHIANVLQARMTWHTAEACAKDIVDMFERKNWKVQQDERSPG